VILLIDTPEQAVYGPRSTRDPGNILEIDRPLDFSDTHAGAL